MATTSDIRQLMVCSISCIWLAACGGDPAISNPPSDPTNPETIAIQIIADMLRIPAEEIKVISAEAREFSDSSLDCPEPGMSYLQVITPGHQVIVEGNGRRFDIRVSGGHGRVCHKAKRQPASPGNPPGSMTR